LLRDIPTSIYALKMLRQGADVSPSSWLRHCLQEQIKSLLQVICIQSNILQSNQAAKSVILTYTTNQNRSYTCSEMLNPGPYFSNSIRSYAALPVEVANASKPDAEFSPN